MPPNFISRQVKQCQHCYSFPYRISFCHSLWFSVLSVICVCVANFIYNDSIGSLNQNIRCTHKCLRMGKKKCRNSFVHLQAAVRFSVGLNSHLFILKLRSGRSISFISLPTTDHLGIMLVVNMRLPSIRTEAW